MFNHYDLIEFACLRFSADGVTRPMLEAYFSAWVYNEAGAETMTELLEMTDGQEITDWWSKRNAEPSPSAENRQSSAAIDGGSFAGLMANLK